jgi:hypothetical protein
MITVVIPLHRTNLKAALKMAERLREVGGAENHPCVIATDHEPSAQQLRDELEGVFHSVEISICFEKPERWPDKENEIFAHCAREFKALRKTPWLRLEVGCMPKRAAWLIGIEAEYKQCGKPILCSALKERNRFPGVAVFPPSLIELSLRAFMSNGQPWYGPSNEELSKHAATSKLMGEDESAVLATNQETEGGSDPRHCFVQLGRYGDILRGYPEHPPTASSSPPVHG